MTYGFITLGKSTEHHVDTLKALGYGVEVVRGDDKFLDHIKVRISGFVTKKLSLTEALCIKIADRKGALTYDTTYVLGSEERFGVKLCGLIKSACKQKGTADFTCLMMRREPKPRKKGSEVVTKLDLEF